MSDRGGGWRVLASARAFSGTWPRFASVVVMVLAGVSLGWAQTDVVSEIDVQGNRRIPAETVRARILTRAGTFTIRGRVRRLSCFSDRTTGRFSTTTTPTICMIIRIKHTTEYKYINVLQ